VTVAPASVVDWLLASDPAIRWMTLRAMRVLRWYHGS
jgi:hypothetical protein